MEGGDQTMETKPAPLWTPADVARFLGVPVATLYQWRRRGVGPPARRVGRHLRYDPDAVRAWFNAL
jgi:DNA-binding transcriptional MerR regulator